MSARVHRVCVACRCTLCTAAYRTYTYHTAPMEETRIERNPPLWDALALSRRARHVTRAANAHRSTLRQLCKRGVMSASRARHQQIARAEPSRAEPGRGENAHDDPLANYARILEYRGATASEYSPRADSADNSANRVRREKERNGMEGGKERERETEKETRERDTVRRCGARGSDSDSAREETTTYTLHASALTEPQP